MPREVGQWTRDKLRLLSLYLPPYLTATTRALDRIYIDGFAGPGTNILRDGAQVDGSPLIALDAAGRSGSRFTRLIFIEADSGTADELEDAVQRRGEQHRAEVVRGDVNSELPRIVQALPKRAPTFVFLDTETIDPAWSTIERIKDWQVEFLINFPLAMAINRNPDSAKAEAYFGTDEWRTHWDRRDYAGVRGLYKRRLAELGFTEQQESDYLIRTSGTQGQHLYYLIPASKHEAARRIWEWVFEQPDIRGQGRLL